MSHQAGEQDERPMDVAEEVSRLADAVQAWWASSRGPGTQHEDHRDARAERRPDDQEHERDDRAHLPEEHVSSCRICPLCRALDLVRAVRPEVLQQLATAAETVAVLLREAAGDRDHQAADQPPPPAEDDPVDDVAVGDPYGDLVDPFTHGTPIAVTDGYEPMRQEHEDEGGRTAWA